MSVIVEVRLLGVDLDQGPPPTWTIPLLLISGDSDRRHVTRRLEHHAGFAVETELREKISDQDAYLLMTQALAYLAGEAVANEIESANDTSIEAVPADKMLDITHASFMAATEHPVAGGGLPTTTVDEELLRSVTITG